MEPGTFRGTIAPTYEAAVPWWPERPRPRVGAPNVLLIVLDDVGFAQLGCFGSDLHTPVLDGLAARGLRYTNFHTTALCSPTRACLLTGRNHHRNGMGRVIDLAMGFPGYDAQIPRANGFLSEALVAAGYATLAIGKWHLSPEHDSHVAGSRATWPLGRGFERFYGFMDGETHQFAPSLVCDNHPVRPPRSIEDGYHLTEDLVDRALESVTDLHQIDPAKPFFLYFCTGACHSPHQAPAEWIARERGRFDAGWDAWREATFARQQALGVISGTTELSARPDWVPAWDALSGDERRLYARYMEAFAGFLAHSDDQIGRLLAGLEALGVLEDTVVMVLSDNGASSEGGPTGSVNDVRLWNVAPRTLEEALARIDEIGGPHCHNNYPWGWTVAGNTPFRRWKREVHEGGVADPLIVAWGAGIAARGELRGQYVHAVDLMPTVLELAGVEPPAVVAGVEQAPLDGVSFAETFADRDAPDRHRTQYYEMFGCRALYHEGWKAVTYHPIQDTSVGFDADTWELYDVVADPSECHDLAAAEPARLRALVERWWIEAGRNQVLPLDNRPFSEFTLGRPEPVAPRRRYVYRPGQAAVPEPVAVNVRNRDHTVTASLSVPDDAPPPEGVLVSQGSGLGGWVLYLEAGRPRYVHNYVGLEEHAVAADAAPLGPGDHEVGFRFTRTGEHRGTVRLVVDGAVVGEGEVPRFTPMRFSLTGAGLSCGESNGLPVTRALTAPARCTAELFEVVVEVDGPPFADPEGEAHVAITRQ